MSPTLTPTELVLTDVLHIDKINDKSNVAVHRISLERARILRTPRMWMPRMPRHHLSAKVSVHPRSASRTHHTSGSVRYRRCRR